GSRTFLDLRRTAGETGRGRGPDTHLKLGSAGRRSPLVSKIPGVSHSNEARLLTPSPPLSAASQPTCRTPADVKQSCWLRGGTPLSHPRIGARGPAGGAAEGVGSKLQDHIEHS